MRNLYFLKWRRCSFFRLISLDFIIQDAVIQSIMAVNLETNYRGKPCRKAVIQAEHFNGDYPRNNQCSNQWPEIEGDGTALDQLDDPLDCPYKIMHK